MTESKKWTAADMADQSGRVAIVTGANSGIGYETARALVSHGAHVVLASRNPAKGDQAVAALRRKTPTARVELLVLDLASLASIRQFVDAFKQRHARLDLLINNAGVMAIPFRQTADGFEMQFGTNHLGHFALTGLLLDRLSATPAARVVTVSSMLHRAGAIDFANLTWATGYDKRGAYSRSKLANLLFAYELQRRLAAAGADVISVGSHPGYAATNLQAAGPEMSGAVVEKWLMAAANRLVAQSSAMGALPTLYAAAAPDVQGGDYIGPTGWVGMRGYPGKVESSAASHDPAVAARLWQVSEELTGVRYGTPAPAAA